MPKTKSWVVYVTVKASATVIVEAATKEEAERKALRFEGENLEISEYTDINVEDVEENR